MALKRKTQEAFGNDDGDDDDGKECRGARGIAHPVLSLTFRKVVSLADFLLESLDGKFSSQRGRIQELMRCDFGESQDGVADILRGVLVGMDAPRDGESCDGSGKQLRSKDHRSVPPIAAKRKTDMPQVRKRASHSISYISMTARLINGWLHRSLITSWPRS